MNHLHAVGSLKQSLLITGDGQRLSEVKPQECAGAPFEWASITKTLTATISHALGRQGVISLLDPISVANGPFTNAPDWITPQGLISHTSGLPRMPDGMTDRADPYRDMTRQRFTTILPGLWAGAQQPEASEEEYSNLGYAVLTLFLEHVTGRTWAELAVSQLEIMNVTEGVFTSPPHGGLVRKTLLGRVRSPWSLSDGPFIGAGGLWGTLDALAAYGVASRQWWNAAAVPVDPLGWRFSGGYWAHTGGSRDTSAIVVFDDSIVLATATIGYGPYESEKVARSVLSTTTTNPRTSPPGERAGK